MRLGDVLGVLYQDALLAASPWRLELVLTTQFMENDPDCQPKQCAVALAVETRSVWN
jgi:hypothetical protein